MKKHFKAIELKHLEETTIMKIREWRNQPFVKNMMYSQHDITEKEHKEYVKAVLNDKNRGLFVFYLDNVPFGVYQYMIYPEENYVKNGHYLIAEDYQYLGYGALLSFFEQEIATNVLGCKAVYAEVLSYNRKAMAMNKKLGAQLIGIQEKGATVDGISYDVYQYIIEDGWTEKKKKMEKIVYEIVDDFDFTKDVIY